MMVVMVDSASNREMFAGYSGLAIREPLAATGGDDGFSLGFGLDQPPDDLIPTSPCSAGRLTYLWHLFATAEFEAKPASLPEGSGRFLAPTAALCLSPHTLERFTRRGNGTCPLYGLGDRRPFPGRLAISRLANGHDTLPGSRPSLAKQLGLAQSGINRPGIDLSAAAPLAFRCNTAPDLAGFHLLRAELHGS